MNHPPSHYKKNRCYRCGKRYPVGGKCCITYHETIASAEADGWVAPYVGDPNGPREARIYGRLPGNHRMHRCYLRMNDQANLHQ